MNKSSKKNSSNGYESKKNNSKILYGKDMSQFLHYSPKINKNATNGNKTQY